MSAPLETLKLLGHAIDGGGELFSMDGKYELTGGFWAGANVSVPLPGDCDGDGDVDLLDVGLFQQSFGN